MDAAQFPTSGVTIHCLRIYFTSRAPVEPPFVIGHVGRHFDVGTTS